MPATRRNDLFNDVVSPATKDPPCSHFFQSTTTPILSRVNCPYLEKLSCSAITGCHIVPPFFFGSSVDFCSMYHYCIVFKLELIPSSSPPLSSTCLISFLSMYHHSHSIQGQSSLVGEATMFHHCRLPHGPCYDSYGVTHPYLFFSSLFSIHGPLDCPLIP